MKRALDLVFSILFLIVGLPILAICMILLFGSGHRPIFKQLRIGRHGLPFTIYKFRTVKDEKVTKSGRLLRKTKLDELPQLYNILKGDMSFVGPRPDLPGYADQLEGEDRVILSMRPGLTSPASIYFRNEEQTLDAQSQPEVYNRMVIWPKKVELNKKYVQNHSLAKDFYYLLLTIYVVCNPRSGYLLHTSQEKK